MSEAKKHIKNFALFCVILILIISISFELLCVNDAKDEMHILGFYSESDDSIDVILLGASELFTGFSSPQAWKEYGFTSYSVSIAGAPINLYNDMLSGALSHQKPKLIVIEAFGFLESNTNKDDEVMRRHTWIDTIPWSKDKWDDIMRLNSNERMNYLYKFYNYHSNWRHINTIVKTMKARSLLKINKISYTKCFSTTTSKLDKNDEIKQKLYFSGNNETELINTLEYCKKQDLQQILFVIFPHYIKNADEDSLNRMSSIVSKYGYDFINLQNEFESIGLNVQNDFYNYSHMNVYGMQKFTSYFSKYIVNNYDVKTEHTEKEIQSWNLCAEKMDRIVADCEQNIDNGVKKTYYEISAY